MSAPIRGVKFSARSPEKLAEFYREVLGWTTEWEELLVGPAGRDPRHLGKYGVINTGYPGDVFVSVQPYQYATEYADGLAHVGTTIAVMVDNLDAALKRALDRGAKIVLPPVRPSVRAGYMAEVADPEGNVILLWEPVPTWEPDEWAKRIGFKNGR